MPYEYVEFDINPPIGEAIGKVPEHIKPIYENGAITKLQVILGEERTETIKKSNHFKKISNEISGIDFVNLLEQEIRDYATQRAKDFINQVNFKLDSPRYKVQLTTLAVLKLQRYLSISTGAYIIDFNSKTDIFEIEDEDNFCSRIVDYYLNGLNARENGDLVSAYRYFYLVIPENRGITSDRKLNRDLKILRHGASHRVLNDQKLMDRAKDLLGDEYVKRDSNSGSYYAYVDITTPGHIDLFKTYIPIIKKSAKDYIDGYMKSHIK